MAELPSGVVSFLFTDVEGSTRGARALGDARWAELLEAHRALLRAAFGAHGGREVDAEGDAFFVAFARATEAAQAAVAAQRALAGHAWPDEADVRVRMGIHTGEALLRDGRYVGLEVHRARRICDAGHGGQILLSQTTADLLRGRLSGDAALVDLGAQWLKDVGEERLFQLGAAGLASEFPPLRSAGEAVHSLPRPRSSFVGRGRELAAVRKLLVEHRLVTLTGVGGCGKTRLAVEVGAAELDGFPDGVFFADLGPVSDPDLVARTLASAAMLSTAGTFGAGSTPLEEVLLDFLSRRRCLLIVDNCEHLLDKVAEIVDRILTRCPQVVVCATSREALEVEGEHSYRVPSLDVASDALALFAARAEAARSGFSLEGDDARHVAEICRRLDGIPLAIEFAAARVAHLSPAQIAERLTDMFRLLTGGRRRIQRQQTLEAALDWSHDLLDEAERILLRRLAVFAGHFDLPAAEAVCAYESVERESVLDLLGSLVAKSLVTSEEVGGAVSYRLLETVRSYASQKLRGAGEAEALRGRHRDHYLAWLESFPLEETCFGAKAISAVVAELDNLRVALDWCAADDRPDLIARIAARPFGLWWFAGRSEEGHRWLLRAVADPERLPLDQQISCHAMLSNTSMMLADGKQGEHATRAIELAAGRPSPQLVAALAHRSLVLATFSMAARKAELGQAARRDAAECVAVAGSGLAPVWLVYARGIVGQVELVLRDVPAAAEAFQAAEEVPADRRAAAQVFTMAATGLSVSQHLLGEPEAALAAAFRAHELWEHAYRQGIPIHIESVLALAAGGERALALRELRASLAETVDRGVPLAANLYFVLAGALAQIDGRSEAAARLLAAAGHSGGASNLPISFRTPSAWALHQHYVPLVREALGPEEARRARDEGRAMSVDEAVAYTLEFLAD